MWLGLFAFKHVEYRTISAAFQRTERRRFLRASVGAATLVPFAAIARLTGSAPHETREPTDEELDEAAAIIARERSTFPFWPTSRQGAALQQSPGISDTPFKAASGTWGSGRAAGLHYRADPGIHRAVRRLRRHALF